MAFISASTLVKSRASAGQSDTTKIWFATDIKHGKNGSPASYSMRISLPDMVAKSARFICGDRVDVLFEVETRTMLLKRVTTGGWALSKNNKSSKTLAVKVTWVAGMPTAQKSVACRYYLSDEGIVFELPECVSFEKNLRAV